MDFRLTSSSAGFSLIELMVVVAVTSILAIGAALALPVAGRGPARAAETFAADLAEMRRLAMVTGLDHAVLPGPEGWQTARRGAGDGWTALGPSRQPGVAVLSAAEPIVARADGSLGPVAVAFEAGSRRVLCRSETGGLPRCAAP